MSKLLFDQNLSPQLVKRLANLHPDATHVALIGLDRASDSAVWEYAHAHDCIIVTKDSDFTDMSIMRGFPPKVLWLRLGNCTTSDLEQALRRSHNDIIAFAANDTLGVQELV